MRILHLGKYYAPYRGGMETVLQNVAEGLLAAGHEVSVLAAGPDSLDRAGEITDPRTGRRGRLLRTAVLGHLLSQPLTASLPGALRREMNLFRPDVVHLHLPNPLAAAVWECARRPGRGNGPALAVWHHADVTRQRLGGRLFRPLLRRVLHSAEGVCVSSRALADRSVELAGLKDGVEVVPFGISPEPWSGVEAGRDGPFLFLGRLVPYKGLTVLLEAMRRVPEADLVIVGEGPLDRELREAVRAGDLAGRVSLVGRLETGDVLRLMARARALVLPSVDSSETFGLVQLEAMAAGLPVVATKLPTGVPEVGIDGETARHVEPGDAGELAGALRELATDDALCRRLGESGKRRFGERFTRERMIERLVPWYESLAARRGRKVAP